MQNSARLQQLGIPPLSSIMPNMRANAPDKRKRSCKNSEHSESEYEPSQNDSGERDSIDDDSDKVLIPPSGQSFTSLFADAI
jgi:hypothetical protein